ncbi:hypothetical protein CYLTODRAFT_408252 [Cylindrobasidium torrendii FP15055 ss-10]|uniref:Uncharacterized protein n=1 Tax=Cylindrobasidium torrendii FP15055 ss-10 TaxID=1314674 RepID=A0A0D7BL65_9AGAR|nr:hypothetical protein CYLTODRAFT_408252 [Cylindrobasidium torrendii FP15055 ss-10]
MFARVSTMFMITLFALFALLAPGALAAPSMLRGRSYHDVAIDVRDVAPAAAVILARGAPVPVVRAEPAKRLTRFQARNARHEAVSREIEALQIRNAEENEKRDIVANGWSSVPVV